MRLPWPDWGETDWILTRAHRLYRAQICPCGCGHHRDDCLNPDTEGRWQVVMDVSQSQKATEAFRKAHENELEPGTLLAARLLPPGAVPEDPFDGGAFDPARVAEEQASLAQRLAAQEATTTS